MKAAPAAAPPAPRDAVPEAELAADCVNDLKAKEKRSTATITTP